MQNTTEIWTIWNILTHKIMRCNLYYNSGASCIWMDAGFAQILQIATN